jgi:CRP-like cAMP-binding protein
MPNPFLMKLEHAVDLTDEDRVLLERAVSRTRPVEARVDLILEDAVPTDVHVVLSGFACRYKILPDGRRQIMALLIPGDACDLQVQILREMDHSIGALTPCVIAEISPDVIRDLASRPRLIQALWWSTLVDEAILREWLVSMGQRQADQQLAHMLCELLVRLQTVGLACKDRFDLPFTQEELADVLGITTVHVNRVLQGLRHQGLIDLKGKTLTIPNVERLKDFADFNPKYLHLSTQSAEPERRRVLG